MKTVVISGPQGSGKTALAHQIASLLTGAGVDTKVVGEDDTVDETGNPVEILIIDGSNAPQQLRIELFKDTAGEWRWRTICPQNGEPLGMSSEGYVNRSHCVKMIGRHFGAAAQYVEVKA